MCGYVPLSTDAHRGQKRASEPLGLELQVLVNWLMCQYACWELDSDPVEEQYVLFNH